MIVSRPCRQQQQQPKFPSPRRQSQGRGCSFCRSAWAGADGNLLLELVRRVCTSDLKVLLNLWIFWFELTADSLLVGE